MDKEIKKKEENEEIQLLKDESKSICFIVDINYGTIEQNTKRFWLKTPQGKYIYAHDWSQRDSLMSHEEINFLTIHIEENTLLL